MNFRNRVLTDMMEFKRPEFDEAEQVHLGNEPILRSVSIDIGERVIVRYKGYNVHMIVKEKRNDTEFVGQIYGLELIIRHNYKEFFLEKEVIFEKKHVCAILKKAL